MQWRPPSAPRGSPALPAELERLLDATLRETRLADDEGRRLREDLRAHLLDGLEAGASATELAARLGRPDVVGPVLRGGVRAAQPATRRAVRVARRVALVQLALVALAYGGSTARLIAGRPQGGGARGAVERAAHASASRATRVSAMIDSAGRAWGAGRSDRAAAQLRAAFEAAYALHARGDVSGELAGLILMDRALQVADSLVPQAELSDRLLALGGDAPVRFHRERLRATLPSFVRRLYRPDGRLAPHGLALLANLKGVERPSAWATLLAPVYFVAPASEPETAQLLARVLGDPGLAGAAGATSVAARWRVVRDSGEVALRDVVAATIIARIVAAERAAERLDARSRARGRRGEVTDAPRHGDD